MLVTYCEVIGRISPERQDRILVLTVSCDPTRLTDHAQLDVQLSKVVLITPESQDRILALNFLL